MRKFVKLLFIFAGIGILSFVFYKQIKRYKFVKAQNQLIKATDISESLEKKKWSLVKRPVQKKIKATVLNTKNVEKVYDRNDLDQRYSSWGLLKEDSEGAINLLLAWKKFKKRKDVVVAVIDTGVDPKHPFLKGTYYLPFKKTNGQNFGLDFSKGGENNIHRPYDTHGHGTHVAGIIKSIFPDVKILYLKYYNPNASGQENLESTIEALKYAVKVGVDVINYSGGGPEPAIEELRVLKEAERKGIFVAAAAGNEESNIDINDNAYYPASYGLSNIMTVMAHDNKVMPISASNFGVNSVDISAPGFRIKSSLPNERAGMHSGTSQATAFVSGVAALIKSQYPEFSAVEIKDIITQSSKRFSHLGEYCRAKGILDASDALDLAESQYEKIVKKRSQEEQIQHSDLRKEVSSSNRLISSENRFPNALKTEGQIILRKAN